MDLNDFKKELSSIRDVASFEKQTEQQKKAQLSMDAEGVLTQLLPLLSDTIKIFVKEIASARDSYVHVHKAVEIDLSRLNSLLRLLESWLRSYSENIESWRYTRSEADLDLHTTYNNVSVFRYHWEYIADKLIDLTGTSKARDTESSGCLAGLQLQTVDVKSGFLGKNKSYRYKSILIYLDYSTYRTSPA